MELEHKYVNVLKYLNYQKIEINNELLDIIYEISINNLNENCEITIEQIQSIKNYINIFKDMGFDNYIYYIFIIENLPNFLIRNLFRTLNYHVLKEYEHQYKAKYDFNTIVKSSNPKELLTECLIDFKSKNKDIINLFVECINDFFT
jgi:hypothetical protein